MCGLLLLVVLLSFPCGIVKAEANAENDIVFLLDTSASMKDSDAIRAAPDSILTLMSMMGPMDREGVIAFSTEVVPLQPLAHFTELKPQAMMEVPYTGYTNTGAALTMAMDWLEPATGSTKMIVVVTDGEIMLPERDMTLRSIQQFYGGIERASAAKIPIYIYRITSDTLNPEYHIHSGYMEVVSGTSEELLEKIWQWKFVQDMKPTLLNIPLEKQNGLNKIKLPLEKADNVRLVLRSSEPGNAWFGNKRTGPILKGERVKIFEFQDVTEAMDLRLDYPEGATVQLDAMVEAGGKLQIEALTLMVQPGITLKITPVTEDTGSKLLSDATFNGRSVRVTVDGEEEQGTVQDGTILVHLKDRQKNYLEIDHIAFDDLNFMFTGQDQARVAIHHYNYLAWLLAALGIALIMWLLVKLKHKNERSRKQKVDLVPPDEGIAFRGRVSVYVMHTPDDCDIPPADYQLQRRHSGRGVTLAEILQSCGISIDLADADKIILGPLEHGIYILNHSDYKVSKRHDVVAKTGRAELFYGESVYIASNDGETELLLMYQKMQ